MPIRVMTIADQPQIERLYTPEKMDCSVEYLARLLDRNPDTCFVYENHRGMIVAAACGLYNGRHGLLQHVATLPNERGKGYGVAVVNAVLAKFREMGVPKLRLFVAVGNEQVIPFYQKLGFAVRPDVIYMGLD